MKELIDKLMVRFSQDLPGRPAQYKMSHVLRRAHKPPPIIHKDAAVLILLYPIQGQPHLVLIERTNHKNDSHSGQMSLPGGRKEVDDIDLETTALREAEEEIGVDRSQIEVLGRLTDIFIPVSNFLVTPVVAYTTDRPNFVAAHDEVNLIVETPLSIISDEIYRKKKDIIISERMTLKNVPFFDVKNKVVWGATAMILSELSALNP